MLAELDFDALASVLASNADYFVGRMTQQGRSKEQAQAEFTAILEFLRQFTSIQATTEVLPKIFKVRIDGTWK
jgi:hypothetical protein